MRDTMKATMIFKTMMIAALVALVTVPQASHAQVISKKGTSSANFLLIPVGTRAAGLGGAITATAGDATAMYWNPGALASVTTTGLTVEHSQWIADLQHTFVGFTMPAAGGTLGLSVIALTMDDMEETTFEQQMGTGRMFGAASYAAGVSFARYLLPDFSIGGTVKYVHERIMNTSSNSFAVDIGTSYVTPFDGIRFGVRIANFGSKMNLDGDDLITTVDIDPTAEGNNNRINAKLATRSYSLPLMLQVGLAWDAVETEMIRATVMADALSPSDNNQSINVGVELSFYRDLFSVQAGLPELLLGDDRMWLFGAGGALNYTLGSGQAIRLGYAAQNHKYLGLTSRLSLSVNF
jgi:hypothetical protein